MGKELNNKTYFAIKVLTPLNIGAGQENDWMENVDFVTDKRYLYKFNLRRLMHDFGDVVSSKVGTKGLYSAIGSNNLPNYSQIFKRPTDASRNPIFCQNPVKTIAKNNLTGNPIIAGSSLKGAIRSVLYQYFDVKRQKENDVFGTAKNGDDFMRFVKISDAEFGETKLINTKIFNLWNDGNSWCGGWKHGSNNTNEHFKSDGFNTIYECIPTQNEGYVSIMLSPAAYNIFGKYHQHIKNELKQPILEKGITKLFDIINNHTREYLKKECAFFKTYSQAEYADEIIASIDDLIGQIPTDNNSCILKMSAGSGFHSITGDWQLPTYSINGLDTSKRVSRGMYNNDKSAKSRKIADTDDGLMLMGFVKLTKITEDEYCQWNIIEDSLQKLK